MDPPGRFLYMNNSTFKWDIVASNIAREKVCQTLRDAIAMEKDYKLLHEAINSSALTPRKDNDDAISYKAEIASVKESAEVDIEEEEESCSENTRLLPSNDDNPQKEHSSASNPQQPTDKKAALQAVIQSAVSNTHWLKRKISPKPLPSSANKLTSTRRARKRSSDDIVESPLKKAKPNQGLSIPQQNQQLPSPKAWAESLIGSKLSTSHGHFTLDRIDYSAEDGMHYICKFDDDDKDDKDYPMTYEDFKNHAYTSGLDVPESPENTSAMTPSSTQVYKLGTRVSKMFFDEKRGVMRLYDGSVKSYGE